MKVSIVLITYNHANFIAQAINSLLMQKVSFEYEIIISEDFSTDGTREIIIGFQKNHPDKIRLLLSERNLNSNEVVTRAIQASRGQYIALLDGDDYWLSPDKLQKQVDFLDQHPECALCFHNAIVFYEDGSQESRLYVHKKKQFLTLEELFTSSFPTCSTMFRNGLITDFPEWFYTLGMSDGPLHILNAQHGEIGYIDEVMGAYRIHKGGVWSSLSKIRKQQEYIKLYEAINVYTKFRYRSILKSMISECYYCLAFEHARSGDLLAAQIHALNCLREQPFNKRLSASNLVGMLLLLCSPKVYQMVDNLLVKRRSVASIQ